MVERLSLPRSVSKVMTPYGEVRIKIAILGENRVKFSPEYEDCRLLAEQTAVPLRDVYQAAIQAAEKTFPQSLSE